MIIAASNVPEDLDAALTRRFDLALEFPAPERRALAEFAKRVAKERGGLVVNGVKHAVGAASTFAEVERIILSEQRRLLLREG